jgi:hypothetical protein
MKCHGEPTPKSAMSNESTPAYTQVDKTVAEPGKKQRKDKASFSPSLAIIIIPILIILIPLRQRIIHIPDDNSRAAATRSQTAFLGSGSL